MWRVSLLMWTSRLTQSEIKRLRVRRLTLARGLSARPNRYQIPPKASKVEASIWAQRASRSAPRWSAIDRTVQGTR